jgi:hypothetical protein
MRTKAMQISTTRQHSRALHKTLITALAKNPIYIPWTMKCKNPTNYKNNIRAHHKYLPTTWTIPLGGTNRNEMWYLQNYFLKTGLVTAVHPHQDTDLKGRWNLLIHKDNNRQGLVNVREVLGNYNTLVPGTTNIRAQWDFPRVAGNEIVHNGDSSSGDRTYASLSVASLVSVLTQEDFNMVVSTTNTTVDLTHRELTVPSTISAAPRPNYNHTSYAQVVQSVNSTLPQPSHIPLHNAQAEIAHLRFKNAQLQSIVTTRPLLASSLPTDFTSTSTITASAAVATVAVEQFQSLSDKYDSILLILQSFQKSPNPLSNNSPMDITTNEKHGQRDASSLVEQQDSKRLDSKVTPNKSHPIADAVMTQSP